MDKEEKKGVKETISRSAKIRRCRAVYSKYFGSVREEENQEVSLRKTKKKSVSEISEQVDPKPKKPEKPKRQVKLSEYQLFIQRESQNPKYNGYNPRERLSLMAKEWRRMKADSVQKIKNVQDSYIGWDDSEPAVISKRTLRDSLENQEPVISTRRLNSEFFYD